MAFPSVSNPIFLGLSTAESRPNILICFVFSNFHFQCATNESTTVHVHFSYFASPPPPGGFSFVYFVFNAILIGTWRYNAMVKRYDVLMYDSHIHHSKPMLLDIIWDHKTSKVHQFFKKTIKLFFLLH
ncbi:hypothetical protein Ancab_008184 [Ancistrocladus abbreviatus]